MRSGSRATVRCPECNAEFPIQPGRLRLQPHPARGPSGLACAGSGRVGEWVAPRYEDFDDIPRRKTG